MADKSYKDFSKRPVQDSHDHEKPLPIPLQETGVPQGSELALPGQPRQLQGEIPPWIIKLAHFIVFLLVFLLNLPVESFNIIYTMTRAAGPYFRIPHEVIEEMERMKHKEVEIRNQLKESCDEIDKLEKVIFHFQDTYSVILQILESDWGACILSLSS